MMVKMQDYPSFFFFLQGVEEKILGIILVKDTDFRHEANVF